MLIFWRLVLAHFIADFTLQTNKVAQWKRVSRWGMVVHVLCHPLMYLLFCWNYLSWPWLHVYGLTLNGWTSVVLIVLLHWLEDEARVWCIRRGTPDSTAFLLWDQAVHLGFLLAFAPTVPGTRAQPMVLVAIGGVLLAHFTSVLIFFLENDMGGHSTVLADGKYLFMLERLAMAALFLLPWPWSLVSGLWMGGLLVQKYRGRLERTWIHVIVAFCAVLLAGFGLHQLFPVLF